MSKNVAKMTKRTTAQMESYIFDLFDPISIIGFLKNFKLASEIYIIREGAAMWLLDFFKITSAFAVLKAELNADSCNRK